MIGANSGMQSFAVIQGYKGLQNGTSLWLQGRQGRQPLDATDGNRCGNGVLPFGPVQNLFDTSCMATCRQQVSH